MRGSRDRISPGASQRARVSVSVCVWVIQVLVLISLCQARDEKGLARKPIDETNSNNVNVNSSSEAPPPPPSWMTYPLFHSPKVFAADYNEMSSKFKVYIYPFPENVTKHMFDYAGAGTPLPGGNYASEFFLFRNLYESSYVTKDPEEAHLFVLPFSVFKLRMTVGPAGVAGYVKHYVEDVIQKKFPYWNRTAGADHFYGTCHDIGSHASEETPSLGRSAIQVICPSSMWHRTYIPHKDLGYPQIWPHPKSKPGGLPPEERSILAFWSGSQNSRVRAIVKQVWEDDEEILLGGGKVLRQTVRGTDYFENFKKAKYCLHITGYQIHTARIGDAIMFGCVPVIISDQYDLPFNSILNWREFAIIVTQSNIPKLKTILKAADYPRLYQNVQTIRRHFEWNVKPQEYDLFNMLMYELWLRRFIVRPTIAMSSP